MEKELREHNPDPLSQNQPLPQPPEGWHLLLPSLILTSVYPPLHEVQLFPSLTTQVAQFNVHIACTHVDLPPAPGFGATIRPYPHEVQAPKKHELQKGKVVHPEIASNG
jgi:hypothetical protein